MLPLSQRWCWWWREWYFLKKISAFFFNEKLPPTNVCKLRINQSLSGLPTSKKKMDMVVVWVVKLVRILDTAGLMLFSLSPVLKIVAQALAFHQWMPKLYPCFAAFSQTGLPLAHQCAHWSQCVWLGYVLVDTQLPVSSWRRWLINSMGASATTSAIVGINKQLSTMPAAFAEMLSITTGMVVFLTILIKYEGVLWLLKQCDLWALKRASSHLAASDSQETGAPVSIGTPQ